MLDEKGLKRTVNDVVAIYDMHKQVQGMAKQNREIQRGHACRCELPNFAIGDHVLKARGRKATFDVPTHDDLYRFTGNSGRKE